MGVSFEAGSNKKHGNIPFQLIIYEIFTTFKRSKCTIIFSLLLIVQRVDHSNFSSVLLESDDSIENKLRESR